MKRGLSFRIADLNITLKNILSAELSERYYFFLSPSGINVLNLNLSSLLKKRENFPLIVQRKEGQVFQIGRNDFLAEVDFTRLQGEVKIAENIYSFDSFLRILYSLYLSLNEGFLLHSAGIKKNGRAYLFSGSSLSGKTSIIRHLEPSLTKGNTILSDEIVAIRKKEQKRGNYLFFAYPTPFWGEFKLGKEIDNQGTKIEKVFFLGDKDLSKLSFKEGVVQLWRNMIFFSKDSFSVNKLLNLGIEFLREVPVYSGWWGNLTNYL